MLTETVEEEIAFDDDEEFYMHKYDMNT